MDSGWHKACYMGQYQHSSGATKGGYEMKKKLDFDTEVKLVEEEPCVYLRRQALEIYCRTRNDDTALRALELFHETIRDEY